jgi:hypothetical protein
MQYSFVYNMSREPGAGSREPGAGSREPGAGSREPGAGSREPVDVFCLVVCRQFKHNVIVVYSEILYKPLNTAYCNVYLLDVFVPSDGILH